jgi:hypothetical protein
LKNRQNVSLSVIGERNKSMVVSMSWSNLARRKMNIIFEPSTTTMVVEKGQIVCYAWIYLGLGLWNIYASSNDGEEQDSISYLETEGRHNKQLPPMTGGWEVHAAGQLPVPTLSFLME